MNPPRPVVELRSRNWRVSLKAALDAALGDALTEPTPPSFHDTLKGLK
jgi:hypothetical protein